MQIEVKGRNLPVTDELRELAIRRFAKVDKQVSSLAVLELELFEERNPANPDNQVAEATLHLKGVTLRARESSTDLMHSVDLVADKLARQVKRHRDKRRKRRERQTDMAPAELESTIVELEEEMLAAAVELRFEYAAKLRDEIRDLRMELDLQTASAD